MTEHVCEFKPMLCECECGNALTVAEICKRANAVERLSVGSAAIAFLAVCELPNEVGENKQDTKDALKAYADTLEGK